MTTEKKIRHSEDNPRNITRVESRLISSYRQMLTIKHIFLSHCTEPLSTGGFLLTLKTNDLNHTKRQKTSGVIDDYAAPETNK